MPNPSAPPKDISAIGVAFLHRAKVANVVHPHEPSHVNNAVLLPASTIDWLLRSMKKRYQKLNVSRLVHFFFYSRSALF